MSTSVERLDFPQSDSESLSNNLSRVMADKKVTITQISNDLGIPKLTIHRILQGTTKDPRVSTLNLIATYLNITVDDLLLQSEVSNSNLNKTTKVPIITWGMLEENVCPISSDFTHWTDWEFVPQSQKNEISRNSFAVHSKPSLQPMFPNGTMLIFNPDLTPNDGDIVLLRIKETKKVTVREIIIDTPSNILRSFNSSSPDLIYNDDDYEIVAISVLTMIHNRNNSM